MKKTLLSILVFIGFTGFVTAQNVTITDVAFKSYLLNNSEINTNGDDEIQLSEAQSFTGTIDCSNMGITSLTGIEAFTALTALNCSYNQLTTIDISNNTALEDLMCYANQLTSLDVSNNINLWHLNCLNNQINSLDVSNNIALTDLNVSQNQLTSINIGNNINLLHFNCSNNQLTNIDVSNNTALLSIGCSGNLLTSLDITNNTALIQLSCYNNQLTTINTNYNLELEKLYCYANQITSLDLHNNTALTELNCNENQLVNLDFSNNPELLLLYCSNNQLNYLNLKNGNNINLTTFYAFDNPDLTCIQVDDVSYSTENWTNIDPWAAFSEYCAMSVEEFGDNSFSVYPNPFAEEIFFNTTVKQVTIYDLKGSLLYESANTETVLLSHLEAGIYLLKAKTDNGSFTKKIVKQ